jgi:predicted metal-binding membrane protein
LNPGSSVPPVPLLEHTARNERWIVLAGLALVAAIGLFATLQLGDMLMMPSGFVGGAIVYPVLLFVMWWTMMMAMMLPSAAPAILTFGALSRKFAEKGAPAAPLSVFVAGYAAIWTGFAAVAVTLQLLLSQRIALSMMMAVTSAVIGGGLLVAAGLYQISPLKSACLRKCQTPVMFFARNWQRGHLGALRMGLSHGLYCLGCCWVLMGLLFYGGVMELRWIAGLALYVAAEKLVPAGNRLSQFTGLLLIGWGAWTLYRALG